MYAKRIIPCLDVKNGRVVKGMSFVNLVDAGDPVECAIQYDKEGADELVFLDITASSDSRNITIDMVEKVANSIFIPFTVGGGIRSVDDFNLLLRAGADKVSVNSAAVHRPELISEAAYKFGSQCVVAAIDAKRKENGWEVYVNGGRTPVGLDAVEWAVKCEQLGAGEILLTSMDEDGQKKVYSNAEPQFLDSKLVSQPTAALQLVVKEVARCIELVSDNLKELIAVSTESDSEKIKAVIQNSEDTRKLYERITEYLSELFASGGLTEEQANQTAGIMYILSDVDRMSALCREVCLSLKDKEEKKYKYSKDAMRDMRHSLQLIQEMFTKAVQMMVTGNTEAAKDILQQKEKILDLGIKMRKSHVERVGEGKCKAKLTEPYNRIIHHIDRMGNCCINIVDAVQGKAGQTYLETVA